MSEISFSATSNRVRRSKARMSTRIRGVSASESSTSGSSLLDQH